MKSEQSGETPGANFPTRLKTIEVTHQYGLLSVEKKIESKLCDVGIQTTSDGRIWICVDGEAFIRFKPLKKGDKYG